MRRLNAFTILVVTLVCTAIVEGIATSAEPALSAAMRRHKVDDSEKQLDWKYFRHYSTVRDVMVDPDRFGVPAEALHGKR